MLKDKLLFLLVVVPNVSLKKYEKLFTWEHAYKGAIFWWKEYVILQFVA